jgi:hypothetical protein
MEVKYLQNVLVFAFVASLCALTSAAPIARVDNAAVYYRQAFEQIPNSEADVKLCTNWEKVPLDAAVVGFLDHCGTSRQLLQKASSVKTCNWGWDYSKGTAMQAPELNKSRNLSGAMALCCRILIDQRKYEEAIQITQELIVLSNRLGSERIVVAHLVSFGIAGRAIEIICLALPSLSTTAIQKLSKDISAMPETTGMGEALKFDTDSLIDVVESTAPIDDPDPLAHVPLEKRKAIAADMRRLEADTVLIVALPPDKVADAMDSYRQKLATTSDPKLVAKLMGAPELIPPIVTYYRVTWAMFKTAIAVTKDGPAAIGVIKDPITGQPFTFNKIDGGFQLISQVTHHNLPITLKTGPHALD